MTDVFPRRNLPGDSDNWGRVVETRIDETETAIGIVRQGLQSQNRNTASSLEVLAGQIRAVEEAQEQIRDTQDAIIAAQAEIVATTNFLATQTVSDSTTSMYVFNASNSGLTWEGFNPTYDCSVTVRTGNAGRLVIQISASIVANDVAGVLGIEIVGVTGPSYPGQYATYLLSTAAVGAGVSRTTLVNLSPNTTYTVRTRRGRDGVSPMGFITWRDQTLVVTRS